MINKSICLISLILIMNCSSFQFSKYDGFWSYIKGKPGFGNAVKIDDPPKKGDLMGDRHPYYLWFRIPEVIFNPQGGLYYPDAYVEYNGKIYNTKELSQLENEELKTLLLKNRNSTFAFKDSGIIDYIFVYRELSDPSGSARNAVGYIVYSPIFLIFSVPFSIVTYTIHDIIKTGMLPIAIVYYTAKSAE